MEGIHLPKYLERELTQEQRNDLGQRIWNIFMYQVHELQKVHADPHPGNILIQEDETICMLDFGCVKELPATFYEPYFELTEPGVLDDRTKFEEILESLEILFPDDEVDQRQHYYELFHEVLSLLLKPYHSETWDFADATYFDQITAIGERLAKDTLTAKYKANRGSKHFIYTNRTFFGLYQLMHMIGSEIKAPYIKLS